MNTQIKEIRSSSPRACKSASSRNNYEVNGVKYVLVGDEYSPNHVVLEFLPVEMWERDNWTEEDVICVLAKKPVQDGFIGESEWELSPEDEGYDHGLGESEIIQDAAALLSDHLAEREVRHAS